MKTLFDHIDEPQQTALALPKSRAKFLPRDYQQAGIDEAFRLWDRGIVGALFRQPTGTGKTVSGSLIADLWLQRSPEHRVLVLAHERQLIQQFADEIEEILGITPGIEMGDLHCSGSEQIIVGSRQTLYLKGEGDEAISRLYKFRPELKWLLIIDEAHRWRKGLSSVTHIIDWFERNPEHRRLGLTATPERSDKVCLSKLFPGVASDYRLFDVDGGPCAVNDGWAVPYDQRYIVVEGVDFKALKEVAKDFDKNELERVLGETETLARLCDPLLDIVGRRRTIIFSPGTAMARDVALYINSKLCHEAAVTVDGSYPDEQRKEIYRRHQRGDVQFLSVCGLCREGYNDPGIQCVAVFRPTKSRSLAEQMKGRGCRPLRGVVSTEMTADERRRAISASDKPTCLVIDLVGVSGLGDVPSTAQLMADGKPDEVIQRANRAILAKGVGESVDVAKEIRKAEADIAEESRLRREEEMRQRQAEMDRRAKLNAKARYQENRVASGQGGASHRVSYGNATEKQIAALVKHCGFTEFAASRLKVGQASAILKKNFDQRDRARRQPNPALVSACTPKQADLLKRFGLPEQVSYQQAAEFIAKINRGEIKKPEKSQ